MMDGIVMLLGLVAGAAIFAAGALCGAKLVLKLKGDYTRLLSEMKPKPGEHAPRAGVPYNDGSDDE